MRLAGRPFEGAPFRRGDAVKGRQEPPYAGGPAARGSQTKADYGCTGNANEEQSVCAKLLEIYAMFSDRAPRARTLVNAPEEF